MNDLVIKSNDLIEGIIDMSYNEYKLILYLISKINRNDKEFTKQRITVKEFAELIKCEHNIYSYMKSMAESIVSKKIKILYGIDNMLNINWFSYTDYKADKGMIEFAFNNSLAPYLLNIDMAYTKYFLSNVRFMKSKHSIRIYELLKQYEKIKIRTVNLDDLKIYLGIKLTEYRSYNTFKIKIILTAQRELKKYSDICFDFEEIKESRKIVAIKFLIKKNRTDAFDGQLELDDIQSKETLEEKNIKEYKEITELIDNFNSLYDGNLDFNLIKNLVKLKGIDCVKTCVGEFKHFVDTANKVENTFYDFTKKYGTSEAYKKGTRYKNMDGNKPIQATNYEQREYDDEFFESLYVNLDDYQKDK